MSDAPIGLALIVDDERVDQMIYRRVMEQSGLVGEILAFSLAEQAIEYLRQTDRPQVDVVFLDINMPRMNGLEFLDAAVQEFGKDFARLVIIMLTTSINPKDHDTALSYDAVQKFVYKPLTAAHLEEVAEMVAKG